MQWSVPDCVEEIWDEVEIGPVHQKVSEHYLECHDEMQAPKDEQQEQPKPYLHHRDGGQAKAWSNSVIACIVDAKCSTCELPAKETINAMKTWHRHCYTITTQKYIIIILNMINCYRSSCHGNGHLNAACVPLTWTNK